MEKLTDYLNGLRPADQEDFARRCETSVGYLRKAVSIKQKLGEGLCLRIAAESEWCVRPEDVRPDIDWDYLRKSLANSAQTATETAVNQVV